jgi:alkylated DNA repair dioxygenase AlkB
MKRKLSTLYPTEIKHFLPEGRSWYIVISQLEDKLKWSEEDFRDIWALCPSELGSIKLFGKLTQTPRYQQTYGKDYTFSGLTHKAQPLPENIALVKLISWITEREEKNSHTIGLLINFYKDGQHYIGKHSDAENQLVRHASIYSFSFGAERKFVISSKSQKWKKEIWCPNNSCIIMGGEMQDYYKHSVPKLNKTEKRMDRSRDYPRINVTVRFFNKE